MRIEFEREDKLPLTRWEEFVRLARQAGAGDDTPVNEVMCDGTTDVLWGFRVELTDATSGAPEQVSLPTWLVHDLLRVVTEVAQSDGDVRGLETGARTALANAYDHMLTPVLGASPYNDRDEPEAT